MFYKRPRLEALLCQVLGTSRIGIVLAHGRCYDLKAHLVTDAPSVLTVYIVEDSPIILRLLTRAVESAGAELVGHSNSAGQAIADLSTLEPDLILLDMVLSAGSGLDVLGALQERGCALASAKVVFTNHATPEHRARSFALGATHFLDKSSEGWQALELISRMAWEKRGGDGRSSDRDFGEPNNHGGRG
jgi:CheY-like chemotaxis protein